MNRKILILGLIFVTGCASTTPSVITELVNPKKVTKGMTSDQVQTILGENVVIGYQRVQGEAEDYEPIYKQNPHRVERWQSNDQEFEVQYYFTHIRQADGVIGEDELMPLVFKEGLLQGQGWPFLRNLIKRNKLKMTPTPDSSTSADPAPS